MADRSAKGLLTEGVVIVASILLAFAIDAAWGNHVERQEEARILDQLAVELALYDELLDDAQGQVDRTLEASEYLLGAVHDPRDVPPDSLRWALSGLRQGYRLAAATAAFDLLAGSGTMSLVSSPELRQALSDLAAFISLVEQFEAEELSFRQAHLNPFLAEHFDLYGAYEEADRSEALPPSRFDASLDLGSDARTFSNLLVESRVRIRSVVRFRNEVRRVTGEARAALEAAR